MTTSVLYPSNWVNKDGRQKVIADFAMMRSMSVGALRLVFWPNYSALENSSAKNAVFF